MDSIPLLRNNNQAKYGIFIIGLSYQYYMNKNNYPVNVTGVGNVDKVKSIMKAKKKIWEIKRCMRI